MAKGLRFTNIAADGGFSNGTYTAADALVEAEWASIEDTGKLVNGAPVLSADLYSTATVVDGKVVGGTISDSYNAGGLFVPGKKIQSESIIDIELANGATNNMVCNGRYVRIVGPTGVFNISGIAGGVDGQVITLINTVAFAMTITNDATSATGNRILTLTGADFTTTTAGSATLVYSAAAGYWYMVAGIA